jgi:hypothetical protein
MSGFIESVSTVPWLYVSRPSMRVAGAAMRAKADAECQMVGWSSASCGIFSKHRLFLDTFDALHG